jgi:di/tricarboxylate transporter
MIIPIVVLAVSAVFFAIGRVRADVVALCALLALVLTNVLTPAEALAGFASPVVVMMAGLFVVGGAVLQTKKSHIEIEAEKLLNISSNQ